MGLNSSVPLSIQRGSHFHFCQGKGRSDESCQTLIVITLEKRAGALQQRL